MTDLELDAAYGPIHSRYGPSRRGIAVQCAIAAALLVGGTAVVAFAWIFLRVPGERTTEQLGMLFVGAFTALFVAPLLLITTLRGLGDRLELRALGLVRRSRQLGLEHLRYDELARIEERKRGDATRGLDVFASDGRLVGVGTYERDLEEMAADLERRTSLRREIVRLP